MIRTFSITLAAQGIIVLLSWWLNLHRDSAGLKITLLWVIIFALVTPPVLFLLRTALNKSWIVAVLLGAVVAVVGYTLAALLSGGYIANLGYPLLLVFLASSIPASLAARETKSKIAAYSPLIAFTVILAFGAVSSVLLRDSVRHQRIRIAVVKLTSIDREGLEIGVGLGINPTEYDREMLTQLGLKGRAVFTEIVEYGPNNTTVNHMMIIVTHPFSEDVVLPEPQGDVAFVQQKDGWERIPSDAKLSWRKVELYSDQSRCTLLSVWKSPGHENITQGLCW